MNRLDKAPRVAITKDPAMKKTSPPRTADLPKVSQRWESDQYEPLAGEVLRLVADGKRRLLITSSGAGEGKSTVTAALGRALAKNGNLSVVLIDTDQMRPTLHTLFGLENQRGLGELLAEIYRFDPSKEDPQQFGLGDWLELLAVEGRSGRLTVVQDEQSFAIMLQKGVVVSIVQEQPPEDRRLGQLLSSVGKLSAEPLETALRTQREVQRPLGDILLSLGLAEYEAVRNALRTQFDERLRGIMMLRRPKCAFIEAAESSLSAYASRHMAYADGTGIDPHVRGKFGTFLKQPFLTSQMSAFLRDTNQERLKVLVSGTRTTNFRDSSSAAAFRGLLSHLSAMFDIVLIDSPPVAVASPAEALGRIVDGVLMVVKAEGYDVQIIQRAKEQLTKNGAQILGAILTQAHMDLADPLYYYYGAYTPRR
jgi:Mrp family chromosome partitioning ATPase